MNAESMKRRIRWVSVKLLNILPVIFWLCLIYSFDSMMGANATVLAMIIHESGHVLCYYAVSGKVRMPRGDISGLRISKSEMRNYKEDMLIYGAGIISNLLAIFIAVLLKMPKSDFRTIFITVNFATAVSNLLPIEGYDGQRMIDALLCYHEVGRWAYIAVEAVSFAIVFFMSFVSLFTVYTFGNGYWIMGVFIAALLGQLQRWLKSSDNKA